MSETNKTSEVEQVGGGEVNDSTPAAAEPFNESLAQENEHPLVDGCGESTVPSTAGLVLPSCENEATQNVDATAADESPEAPASGNEVGEESSTADAPSNEAENAGKEEKKKSRPAHGGIDEYAMATQRLAQEETAEEKAFRQENARMKADIDAQAALHTTSALQPPQNSEFLADVFQSVQKTDVIIRGIPSSKVQFVHQHDLENIAPGIRFQCSFCGNVDTCEGLQCSWTGKCGFTLCVGCILRLSGKPDNRPIPEIPNTTEEYEKTFKKVHEHPLKRTNLVELGQYGPKGGYYCDVCARSGAGDSYHCMPCGFDLCLVCAEKHFGRFRPTSGDRPVANDVKWGTLLRSRLLCTVCHVKVLITMDNGWFRCNMCAEFNLCRDCFFNKHDGDPEYGDPHASRALHLTEHTFTNMIHLFWDWVKQQTQKQERVKALTIRSLTDATVPITDEMISKCNDFNSGIYCPCGAEYDAANPYNPRGHPSPFIGKNCAFSLPILYKGQIISPENLGPITCGICKKVGKLSGTIISPLCAHVFCLDCAVAWCKNNRRCPIDGKPLKLAHCSITMSLATCLKEMNMPCMHYDKGCEELIPIHAWGEHVSECQHGGIVTCPLRQIGCCFVGPVPIVQGHLDTEIEGSGRYNPLGCIFPRMLGYIRRNEMSKQKLYADVAALKKQMKNLKDQIALVMHERDFSYGSGVFVDDEESKPPPLLTDTGNSMDAFTNAALKLKEIETGYADNSITPPWYWDTDEKSDDAIFSESKLSVRCKKPAIVLATKALDRGTFYWEIRIDTSPGMGNICVGICQRPTDKKGKSLLNFNQHLGLDENSWAWISTGSVRSKNKMFAHAEAKLRWDKGSYLGFLFVHEKGEMFLFHNRLHVYKITELNKKILDPKSKRMVTPVYYPAVSLAYTSYSVTLYSNAPMQPIPAAKEIKSA